MTNDAPKRITDLAGTVERLLYAEGTKSERMALFLVADDHKWLLRRKEGPAMGCDKVLEKLIGHHVKCSGFLLGSTILAETIQEVGK